MYRFVVCVDISATDLAAAYAKLLIRMNANDWESTDEVYNPDGEAVELVTLLNARSTVLAQKEHD